MTEVLQGHVQIARALYSVPTIYLRKQVRVRADMTTVKIYFGTDLIKLHPRKPPGGEHLRALDAVRSRQARSSRTSRDRRGRDMHA